MKKYKQLIIGIFIGAIVFGALPVIAATIEVAFNTINITVNGQKVNADNILYKGTTYVPLKAIGEMLEKDINWDNGTKTASINDKAAASIPITSPTPEPTQSIPITIPTETETEAKSNMSESISFGNTFTYDNLEITFGSNIGWDKVKNQYSDKDGATVFRVPIKIKNVSDETHGLNMFYFTQYGSKGTKLSGVSSYFDNTVDYSGDVRSGAESNSYMYFLYDGDGDYYVEFRKISSSDKIEVKLPIKK